MPERARVIDYLRSVSMPVNALTIAEALYDDADKGKVDGVSTTLRKLRTAGVAENVNEGATGRGNTGTWRISQASAPLSFGKVDDSDKCARCGSLRIACFDANNTPLCEAHKESGVW